MTTVDLRSDTLTRPTPEMREAMFRAEVGDDVFGEDPAVNELQAEAAGMLEKEAALFVPSGTMANQLAIRTLTQPGDEVLMEAGSHPFMYESGAPAVISSVQVRTIAGVRGLLQPEQISEAVRPKDVHQPPTSLVCLENTHNRGGGSIYPLETIKAAAGFCRGRGISMHMDGARLFNAAVASGIPATRYASYFDTVSFCLSKGLGAPVGSLLCGPAAVIAAAHRWRKLLGGGMRQAGFLAAAGLYALKNNVDRLAEDHDSAQVLARGINEVDGLEVDPSLVETNIVIFRISRDDLSPVDFCVRMKELGVLMLPFGPDLVRAVVHLDVDRQGVEKAVLAARQAVEGRT